MKTSSISKVHIPADVPETHHELYLENYKTITNRKGNLFIFAADQKIEHLHDDFSGKNIPEEVADPEHLFKIADSGKIGAFATQLGLISQYGNDYPEIPYIVKLNSKTNIIPSKVDDPYSPVLWGVEDVAEFRNNSGLNICGIGYTLYLGSSYESDMISQAAQFVFRAHQHGFIATLWIYPRGKNVKNEHDAHLTAGATGLAACLGADFVKIQPPRDSNGNIDAKLLQQAVKAAGRTKVLCAGGPTQDEDTFLKQLKKQVEVGGASGCAVGRNIFQKSLNNAIKLTQKIYKLI